MKPQKTRTVAALAYELNSIALTIAAEAERFVDHTANDAIPDGGVDMMANLIHQMHDAARALRYVRRNGQLPPAPTRIDKAWRQGPA